MDKKNLSLIIIPHGQGKHRIISLSRKKINFFKGLGLFFLLVLVVFLVDYFTMNVTREKYRELLEENEQYKQTLTSYEESISKLQSTIDTFEKYARKLNIMAGLKSSDVMESSLGVGSGTEEQGQIFLPPSAPKDLNLQKVESLQQKADGIEKNLNILTTYFEEQALKLSGTPSVWPTKGWVTSPYGWRNDPFTGKRTFHWGIDIATHYGNPVVATADGVVIETKSEKIGGKIIKISHRGGYTTIYCHLSKFLVKPGQKVKRGDTIGLVGSTGKALGPHVHYEVKRDGKSLNPYYYILEE